MVVNETFKNNSVISRRSVLLVQETGENHIPVAGHWHTLSHNVVYLDIKVILLYKYIKEPGWLRDYKRSVHFNVFLIRSYYDYVMIYLKDHNYNDVDICSAILNSFNGYISQFF